MFDDKFEYHVRDTKNHSALTTEVSGDEFIAYRRLVEYQTVTLLSKIGGLLGLFWGVSACRLSKFSTFL